MTEEVQDNKKRRSCLIIVVIVLALIICLLCIAVGYGVWKAGAGIIPEKLKDQLPIDLPQDVGEEPMPQGEQQYEEDTLQHLTANDQLEVSLIYSVANNGETTGQILEAEIVNNSSEDIFFVVPCGTVLLPEDNRQQRMMVVQQASTSAESGEVVILPMYVVCIDADASAPDAGSDYRLGKPIQGDLGEFADCLCGQTLSDDPAEMMSLQFAVWDVAEEGTLEEVLAEGDNALSDMVGDESMQDIMGMFDMVMQMYGAGAQEWLEQCGIDQ